MTKHGNRLDDGLNLSRSSVNNPVYEQDVIVDEMSIHQREKYNERRGGDKSMRESER